VVRKKEFRIQKTEDRKREERKEWRVRSCEKNACGKKNPRLTAGAIVMAGTAHPTNMEK
jgi:hypothetical protein